MCSRAHLLDFQNPPSTTPHFPPPPPPSTTVANVNASENPPLSDFDNTHDNTLFAITDGEMKSVESSIHNPAASPTSLDNATINTDHLVNTASNATFSITDSAINSPVNQVTVNRPSSAADANAIASAVTVESENYLPRRREVFYRIFAAMRSAASPASGRRQDDANDEDADEFLRSSGSSSSSSGFRRHHIFVKKTKRKSSSSSNRKSSLKEDNRQRQSGANDRELSLQQLRRLHRQHQSQFHSPHHHPQLSLDSSYYGHSSSSNSPSSLSSPDEALEARLFRIIGTAHIVCGVCFMFLHIMEAIFVSSRLLFTIWIGFFYILVGVMCIFGYVKWSLTLSFIVAASAPPLMYFLSPKEICDDDDDSTAGGGNLSSAFPKNCASMTMAALAHSCVIFILAELILCVVGVGCAVSVLVKRRRRAAADRPPSRASRSTRTSTSTYYSATTSTTIDPTTTASSLREARRERNGDINRIEYSEDVLDP